MGRRRRIHVAVPESVEDVLAHLGVVGCDAGRQLTRRRTHTGRQRRRPAHVMILGNGGDVMRLRGRRHTASHHPGDARVGW